MKIKSVKYLGRVFNQDYFERGKETGLSLYENFHWMPKKAFLIAKSFIKNMKVKKGETIIDYGCAKGFVVRALRELGYDAYGMDISNYAVSHADETIQEFVYLNTINCRKILKKHYDVGLCKDVLEHSIDSYLLDWVLFIMRRIADRWLVVVPLGDGQKYVVPEYELDKTHFIKQTKEWWLEKFSECGFRVIKPQ